MILLLYLHPWLFNEENPSSNLSHIYPDVNVNTSKDKLVQIQDTGSEITQ